MFQLSELNESSVDPAEAPLKPLNSQVRAFPSTRFMGSKEQLLEPLWRAIGSFQPQRVLDLCSGSGVVSYMLKAQGCSVVANDQMKMANVIADAAIVNSTAVLTFDDIDRVAEAAPVEDGLIWEIYGELYYSRDEVAFLDAARLIGRDFPDAKRSLITAALIRACIKRRPRGIFTYTGRRYDDGRKDLKIGLRDHFRRAASELNGAVFDNSTSSDTASVDLSRDVPTGEFDVVYLDPPYFSPLSDNEYVRRYHFTEALARDWEGVDVQWETKTKKLRNYPNPFRSELATVGTINRVLDAYRRIPVVLSYSTNSLPDSATLLKIMRQHGRASSVIEVNHRYSFANQSTAKNPVRNKVRELIFIAE